MSINENAYREEFSKPIQKTAIINWPYNHDWRPDTYLSKLFNDLSIKQISNLLIFYMYSNDHHSKFRILETVKDRFTYASLEIVEDISAQDKIDLRDFYRIAAITDRIRNEFSRVNNFNGDELIIHRLNIDYVNNFTL